jgi:hypothetical protein
MQTIISSNNITPAMAVSFLKAEGFQATISATNPGWIEVLDMIITESGGQPRSVTHEPRLMHPSQTFRFISDRS